MANMKFLKLFFKILRKSLTYDNMLEAVLQYLNTAMQYTELPQLNTNFLQLSNSKLGDERK